MSNNALLAFVTGLGTGYIGSKDKEAKQAREDEDRAMRKELHAANMKSLNRAEADRQAQMDAGAERTATPGTAVETGAGKNLYFNAAQAGVAADDARIEAEMRGTPTGTVKSYPATGITGNMALGNQITTGPVDEAKLNSREAKFDRGIAAMQGRGNFQGALNLQNSALDQKTKTLGLTVAERNFADTEFNRQLTARLSAGPDWATTAAEILSDTNAGSLAGVTVTAVPSADGKKVNFIGAMPDGTTQQLQSVDNSLLGRAQFLQFASRASAETKINFMIQQAKAQQAQANTDRDFDLRQKTNENAQANSDRTFGLQANADRRADATATRSLNPGQVRIEEAETILGRPLTQPERQRLSGVGGIDEKGDLAFATKIAEAVIKTGADPQTALAVRQDVLTQIQGGRNNEEIRRGLAKAKAEGKMVEAVQDLRDQKMTDKQIISLGGEIPPPPPPPAKEGNLAQGTQLPAAATPSPVQAPVRSTDGGQTWFLDLPAVIRDPSVPYYRTIPNPKLALGKQSFKSRGEAEAAFLQSAQ